MNTELVKAGLQGRDEAGGEHIRVPATRSGAVTHLGFPRRPFPPSKHIQIKIGKLANNLVLLAIHRAAWPRLSRYTATACVHKPIFPPGAPTLLSRKRSSKALLLRAAKEEGREEGCCAGGWLTPGRGLRTGRGARVQRGGHGESILHQRDGAEETAALQAHVLSLQHGPPRLSGGPHAPRGHRALCRNAAGSPGPTATSCSTAEPPSNSPLRRVRRCEETGCPVFTSSCFSFTRNL